MVKQIAACNGRICAMEKFQFGKLQQAVEDLKDDLQALKRRNQDIKSIQQKLLLDLSDLQEEFADLKQLCQNHVNSLAHYGNFELPCEEQKQSEGSEAEGNILATGNFEDRTPPVSEATGKPEGYVEHPPVNASVLENLDNGVKESLIVDVVATKTIKDEEKESTTVDVVAMESLDDETKESTTVDVVAMENLEDETKESTTVDVVAMKNIEDETKESTTVDVVAMENLGDETKESTTVDVAMKNIEDETKESSPVLATKKLENETKGAKVTEESSLPAATGKPESDTKETKSPAVDVVTTEKLVDETEETAPAAAVETPESNVKETEESPPVDVATNEPASQPPADQHKED